MTIKSQAREKKWLDTMMSIANAILCPLKYVNWIGAKFFPRKIQESTQQKLL